MKVSIPEGQLPNDLTENSENYDKVPSLHDTHGTLKNTYKQLSNCSEKDSD